MSRELRAVLTVERRCDSVLMIGTHPQTMGGIASVVRGYIADGLFERLALTYVATHRDGSPWSKTLTALRALARATYLMLRTRPLVHVHLSSRASFWRKSIFCVAARVTGRPYLLHMHGSEFMKFFDEECGRFGKSAVRTVFAHASLMIALSQKWRDDLQRICPTARIEIVPNAVAIPALEHRPANGPRRILFLGRLGNRKGTFDLVRAFAALGTSSGDATLVCAGDGAIAQTSLLARELGIAERVSCPGWLDPAASAAHLATADLFVLPSYAEGLPMALLEAMAAGLAVITTPVGGIPEVVHHMENGYLIQAGDIQALSGALGQLLSSEHLRGRLGAAARESVLQHFSLHAATGHLERIYASYGVGRTQARPSAKSRERAS